MIHNSLKLYFAHLKLDIQSIIVA